MSCATCLNGLPRIFCKNFSRCLTFGAEASGRPRCHGLDKLWKWNVGVFVYIVMNDGALMAVKKLYIRLYAARDMPPQKGKETSPFEPSPRPELAPQPSSPPAQ
jgi:hypothetical protein